VFYNFADIKDYKKFPNRTLDAPENTFEFHYPEKRRQPGQVTANGKEYTFSEYLDENKTVAFLIIKNDTIYYEEYFQKYDEESIVPSFSMAKSVLSILIGCAINDGYIGSVEEPVTNYVPELTGKGFSEVTLEHLLQMTSGVKFNESYSNPFGDAASYYYGRNLRKYISKMELENTPGEQFKYKSGSTQLLGLVLERAL
jgi:CubicO group peptidase (beta-lactamase class C family)